VNDCQDGPDPCSVGYWCDEPDASCNDHGDGDLDFDGDVDVYDFAIFQVCFNQMATDGCEPANMTGYGGMVDLDDFTLFEAILLGPG
jgi:hypothetical protein